MCSVHRSERGTRNIPHFAPTLTHEAEMFQFFEKKNALKVLEMG